MSDLFSNFNRRVNTLTNGSAAKSGTSRKISSVLGNQAQNHAANGQMAGRSETKKHFLGGEYTQHYDADGFKSGTSESHKSLFGGEYTQHYEANGFKSGTSENRKSLFGGEYTQHYNPDGLKSGTSENRRSLFGGEYTQHYGSNNLTSAGVQGNAAPATHTPHFGSNNFASTDVQASNAPAIHTTHCYSGARSGGATSSYGWLMPGIIWKFFATSDRLWLTVVNIIVAVGLFAFQAVTYRFSGVDGYHGRVVIGAGFGGVFLESLLLIVIAGLNIAANSVHWVKSSVGEHFNWIVWTLAGTVVMLIIERPNTPILITIAYGIAGVYILVNVIRVIAARGRR
jgi:hypothetical protein